ncbi:ubiquitin-conjugating enzyme E2 D/E [Kwoniella heveanensis CBS 569]|uniref:E2 ubiquitin-conjugating enzyme n=1 Tax=Kwoniella heveanensis BCC8398 TaxID=1296120 RepID=A0A1B9GR63_9TREE|nr:ubiquitin-conjugating enzyme E2 D/E [Kwoniella heveanensis BCC8398]OCF42055.1 ubiquitin-conjugating enzyme E2 D/E [Kwoniella heveanensis CBS 569]
MASTSTRRIQKELSDLMTAPPKGITVLPDEENIQLWQITIIGPSGTPFAKGKFSLTADFSKDYPFKPPVILFKTKVHHPNIDSDGNLCIGLLKTENWKPATKMSGVLQAIYDLLETPNPDDPLVSSIAEQYRTDKKGFDKKAAEYTAKYAV